MVTNSTAFNEWSTLGKDIREVRDLLIYTVTNHEVQQLIKRRSIRENLDKAIRCIDQFKSRAEDRMLERVKPPFEEGDWLKVFYGAEGKPEYRKFNITGADSAYEKWVALGKRIMKSWSLLDKIINNCEYQALVDNDDIYCYLSDARQSIDEFRSLAQAKMQKELSPEYSEAQCIDAFYTSEDDTSILKNVKVQETMKEIDGMKIPVKKVSIYGFNILQLEVGTNGIQGGDSGHGGRTYFAIGDYDGTDLKGDICKDAFGETKKVEIILGGDSELQTFIQALEFALNELKSNVRNKK